MRAVLWLALLASGCRLVLDHEDKVFVEEKGGAGGTGGEGPAVCRDGVKQASEPCDGDDVGEATCAALLGASDGGAVACTPFCTFDVSGCTPDSITVPGHDDPWPMQGHDVMHSGRADVLGAQTNELAWSTTFDTTDPYMDPSYGSVLVTAEGVLILGDRSWPGGVVRGFDLAGAPIWSDVIGDRGTFGTPSLARSGGVASVWVAQQGPTGGLLQYHYDATSVEHVSTAGPGVSFETGAAVTPSGQLYIADTTGSIYGYTESGALTFGLVTGAGYGLSPAIGADGTVYVVTGAREGDTGTLTAISPEGERKWTYVGEEPGCASLTDPIVSLEGTIYITFSLGCSEYRVVALHPDGTVAWKAVAPSFLYAHGALGADGTLYFPSSAGAVALRPDGSVAWDYAAPNSGQAVSVGRGPAGTRGILYISGVGFIMALRIEADGDPTPLWTYASAGLGLNFCLGQATFGADGTVYQACNDGVLYAFAAP